MRLGLDLPHCLADGGVQEGQLAPPGDGRQQEVEGQVLQVQRLRDVVQVLHLQALEVVDEAAVALGQREELGVHELAVQHCLAQLQLAQQRLLLPLHQGNVALVAAHEELLAGERVVEAVVAKGQVQLEHLPLVLQGDDGPEMALPELQHVLVRLQLHLGCLGGAVLCQGGHGLFANALLEEHFVQPVLQFPVARLHQPGSFGVAVWSSFPLFLCTGD